MRMFRWYSQFRILISTEEAAFGRFKSSVSLRYLYLVIFFIRTCKRVTGQRHLPSCETAMVSSEFPLTSEPGEAVIVGDPLDQNMRPSCVNFRHFRVEIKPVYYFPNSGTWYDKLRYAGRPAYKYDHPAPRGSAQFPQIYAYLYCPHFACPDNQYPLSQRLFSKN